MTDLKTATLEFEKKVNLDNKFIERTLDQSYQLLSGEVKGMIAEANNLVNALRSKLRKVENRLDSVVENVGDIVVLQAGSGKCMNINTSACRMFGVEKSQIIGLSHEEVSKKYPHLAPMLQVIEKFESGAKKTKSITRQTIDYISPNTLQTYRLGISLIPIMVESDEPSELVIIAKDVTTEYNKVNIPVLASTILDQIQTPIVVYDDKLLSCYVNKAALMEFGEKFTINDIFGDASRVFPKLQNKISTIEANGERAEVIPVAHLNSPDAIYYIFVFVD